MVNSHTTQATSGGVAGIAQLPAFELPAVGGGEVRSWDYKGRTALVVWLAGSVLLDSAVAQVATRDPEIRAEKAELIVIVRATDQDPDVVRARARLHGPILLDTDGRVHALLGAEGPTLLVTDRHGTVYWREVVAGNRPNIDEALSWLAYINILEPECGTCVPAWPVE